MMLVSKTLFMNQSRALVCCCAYPFSFLKRKYDIEGSTESERKPNLDKARGKRQFISNQS